ncbi:hypothetical protein [Geosporobacter ferrireducens]|uniref:hypothetical protein n=1 Tax=Geosporobacter ferrireducens TaxID=1424294 RepID=UPI00139E483E|nr:hypothetical protein [Geosporobacter ferrireducens]MTI53749.1 hypothetical protein [Geosporobacter ferrireducens]
MHYKSLDKNIKHSISYSMEKEIDGALKANDWDIARLDVEFIFDCWLSTSKKSASWLQRLPDDLDSNFIDELMEIFKDKIDRIKIKESSPATIEYLIRLAKKKNLEVDLQKIKNYCYAQNEFERIKSSQVMATAKQYDYAKKLYKDVYNSDLPEKDYTLSEMSVLIDKCLKEKNNLKQNKTPVKPASKKNYYFDPNLPEDSLIWLNNMAVKYNIDIYSSINLYISKNHDVDQLLSIPDKNTSELAKGLIKQYIEKFKNTKGKDFLTMENSDELTKKLRNICKYILNKRKRQLMI